MLTLAGILLALVAPAAAQPVQVTLDRAKTHIDWTLGDVLHTVEGTFQLKSDAILFDPKTGEASGQIVVDAASGNSGNGTRDGKMKKEVLETARYSDIVFAAKHVSGFVSGQESLTIQVAGNFTIHGGMHDLTLTLPIVVKNTAFEAHAKFDVPYVNWGMKDPSTLFLKVDKSVQISIAAAGVLQPAGTPQPSKLASLSNIDRTSCQRQRFGPESSRVVHVANNALSGANEYPNLLLARHQRRRCLEHHEAIAAHLREDLLAAEQAHHQHLSKHRRMNRAKRFE
jgi:polyisoprenoid-binding protein YceI